MSIYTTARPKNIPALLMMNFLGARDIEDALSTTTGSLSDLSPVYPGTIDQYSQDRHIYFSDLGEYNDYEAVPTGTSIISSMQVRVPATFKFEIIDHEMLQLIKSANNGDEHTFVEATKNISWDNRSASDLLRGIQLAFQVGAHIFARRLTIIGREQYPENRDLQKYATVLAPVEVIERNLPPDPGLKDNRDWLKAHKDEYKGQWVALQQGELIGASPSLKDLKSTINQTEDILFAKVS
jgi:hypothetical protein